MTAEVPTDYDNPRGRTTTIALTKLPATGPRAKIGSPLTNPGRPGGSGVDFVQSSARTAYTATVRARYDIIGFAPPGGAASDPDQARGRDKFAAFAEEIEARSVWPSVRTDAPPVPLSGDPIKGRARTDADGRGRTRTGATQGPTGARRSRVTPTIGEVTACWTSSQAIAT